MKCRHLIGVNFSSLELINSHTSLGNCRQNISNSACSFLVFFFPVNENGPHQTSSEFHQTHKVKLFFNDDDARDWQKGNEIRLKFDILFYSFSLNSIQSCIFAPFRHHDESVLCALSAVQWITDDCFSSHKSISWKAEKNLKLKFHLNSPWAFSVISHHFTAFLLRTAVAFSAPPLLFEN